MVLILAGAFLRWSGPESAGLRWGFHGRAEHLLQRRELALPLLADCERMLAQKKHSENPPRKLAGRA